MLKYCLLTGEHIDKVKIAIRRLRTFEPPEGYYVAFSGGKDSQSIYHLCKMAGVKFDAHYRVTSVDPPELVQFIREFYPDVSRDIPRDKDGNAVTMWNLIPRKTMPPTRIARYCCQELKESGGEGRIVVTGVRWSESPKRKSSQGLVTILGRSKKRDQMVENSGLNHTVNTSGGIVLNDDNDDGRRLVEQCFRTNKTMVNPIIDWEDADVWEYLNDVARVPHCCLYDEGLTRLGCIGCPMSAHQQRELERWDKYRTMYMHAFDKMLAERIRRGKNVTGFDSADDVMRWWVNPPMKQVEGQIMMEELPNEND